MLFQAVMKYLSSLVEFKILVNWGMVHFDVSPDEGASLETSKFSLYFSGSCIPNNESFLFRKIFLIKLLLEFECIAVC
jgi:hypothetical protein